MLSVLIPTYNISILSLVKTLHTQLNGLNIEFEIICFDDSSTNQSITQSNLSITQLKNTTYHVLNKNIGRSAIRNALAEEAKYNTLLFIDAGTIPKQPNFIEKYIKLKYNDIVSGGMTHLENPPKKPYKLRWLYTKKREFKSLCSSNFMIKKRVFLKYRFDETITTYGYEDVLFFNKLKHNNFSIHCYKNPVIHNADDDANTFIYKTEIALKNLFKLFNNEKIDPSNFKLLKLYLTLKKLKMDKVVKGCFTLTRPLLQKNFNSNNPSIILFDIYKLGYICTLNN